MIWVDKGSELSNLWILQFVNFTGSEFWNFGLEMLIYKFSQHITKGKSAVAERFI